MPLSHAHCLRQMITKFTDLPSTKETTQWPKVTHYGNVNDKNHFTANTSVRWGTHAPRTHTHRTWGDGTQTWQTHGWLERCVAKRSLNIIATISFDSSKVSHETVTFLFPVWFWYLKKICKRQQLLTMKTKHNTANQPLKKRPNSPLYKNLWDFNMVPSLEYSYENYAYLFFLTQERSQISPWDTWP